MGNKIKKCLSVNQQTDELLSKVMELSDAQNVSDLFRKLIEQEAVRLGILAGKITPQQHSESDLTDLYKKISMLITISKESDDKLYIILDLFNNLFKYMEIDGGYCSVDTKLNPDNEKNIHSYIKQSMKNLAERKYRSQLNKY